MTTRHLLPAAGLLAAVTVATAVYASTLHTITVDGDLADFAADEKTAGDVLGDSVYGANNDLSALYVTWDAQKLYVGFDYKTEQTAVMVLVDTGKAGGVSSFCKSGGYNGAFPANVSGPDFDLMIALFAPADHGTASAPYVYALAAASSTDITASSGVQVKLVETVATAGRDGKVEAAIPWDTLYGLGAGKVPAGAALKIAGVLRGKNDDDGLGDASPDPTGGVKNVACGSPGTVLDKLHQVTVDASGDGVPDPSWSPGPNTQKTDGGPPPPDKGQPDKTGPTVDKPATVGDGKKVGDAKKVGDGRKVGDGFGSGDFVTRDLSRRDKRIVKIDTANKNDEGCACAVVDARSGDLLLVGLALAALLVLRRSSTRP